MKYNDIVQTICGVRWHEGNEEEKEGALGVALILAYLKGSSPRLKDLATWLNVKESTLQKPYGRLLQAGLFGNEFDARNDPELLGQAIREEVVSIKDWRDKQAIQNAWCHIAAIASGVIHRKFDKYSSMKRNV